jgi:HEAT repeat protein
MRISLDSICMADDRRLQDLIFLLNDDSARIDERDDAAIDLGHFDDPAALDALIAFAQRHDQDDVVAGACGESIAQIWERQGIPMDDRLVDSLAPAAAWEVRGWLGSKHVTE